MNLQYEIGLRIRRLRLLKAMTQDDLAKKVGYTSRSSINKIEKGMVDLPRSKIVELAEALDTTASYLMGWEEEARSSTSIYDKFNLQMFAPPSEQQLTEPEKQLLDIFRQVPEDQQALVLSMIRAALNIKG